MASEGNVPTPEMRDYFRSTCHFCWRVRRVRAFGQRRMLTLAQLTDHDGFLPCQPCTSKQMAYCNAFTTWVCARPALVGQGAGRCACCRGSEHTTLAHSFSVILLAPSYPPPTYSFSLRRPVTASTSPCHITRHRLIVILRQAPHDGLYRGQSE